MKRTIVEEFKINSPYGIIIRLSDLAYSWFNRNYKEVHEHSRDFIDWKVLYSFRDNLRNEAIMMQIKKFALANKGKGMNMHEEMNEGGKYLRIWLYNDAHLPYVMGKMRTVQLRQYEDYLSKIEDIIANG